MKFYNKIYPQISEYNEYGDLDYDMFNMSSKDVVGYIDDLNELVKKEFDLPCDEPERGLMEYYNDTDGVSAKVRSLFQHFEVIGDDVYYVSKCELTAELTSEETELLKEYIAGQNADGFGEGLEQRPIRIGDGELYVSTWSGNKDFAIMTEQEFAVFQHGDLSQTLSDHGIEMDEPEFEISM
jgi:hypothetical protein